MAALPLKMVEECYYKASDNRGAGISLELRKQASPKADHEVSHHLRRSEDRITTRSSALEIGGSVA